MTLVPMHPSADWRRPLVVTMGEPAGIGGDIVIKAWLARHEVQVPPFFVIDDAKRLSRLGTLMGARLPIRLIAEAAEAAGVFPEALPVMEQHLATPAVPGRPDARNAAAVRDAITRAVTLVSTGEAAAVVTNPIHKATMYAGGFGFPGHTEYLGALAGSGRPIMMLTCPGLRVVPVTVHMSLRQALDRLSAEEIVAAATITNQSLRTDFGIANPRIAVAGINPHAGEDGSMGSEEVSIIAPAIATLRAAGIDAFGPLPPDTMFHAEARAHYDVALCMYHDQALIPLKTIDFARGVNVTLGLPFVRTSPDHGTAVDLAGTGRASASSLFAALRLADEMAARRSAANSING